MVALGMDLQPSVTESRVPIDPVAPFSPEEIFLNVVDALSTPEGIFFSVVAALTIVLTFIVLMHRWDDDWEGEWSDRTNESNRSRENEDDYNDAEIDLPEEPHLIFGRPWLRKRGRSKSSSGDGGGGDNGGYGGDGDGGGNGD